MSEKAGVFTLPSKRQRAPAHPVATQKSATDGTSNQGETSSTASQTGTGPSVTSVKLSAWTRALPSSVMEAPSSRLDMRTGESSVRKRTLTPKQREELEKRLEADYREENPDFTINGRTVGPTRVSRKKLRKSSEYLAYRKTRWPALVEEREAELQESATEGSLNGPLSQLAV